MGRRKRKDFPALSIHGIADKGKAVGRTEDGEVVFVQGAVPGDTVHAVGFKKRKGVWHASIQELESPSPLRVRPICSHFADCGGCKWQHLSYEGQLAQKQQLVEDAVRRIAKLPHTYVRPILGSENIFHYRNKMEYSFSAFRWLTEEEMSSGEELDRNHALGLHRPGSFDKIVDIQHCHLQAEPGNAIRNEVRQYAISRKWSFYNPRDQIGWMRSLILRNNEKGEFMLILVTASRHKNRLDDLFAHLQSKFPAIRSFFHIENQKKNDSVSDLEAEHWVGADTLPISIGRTTYQLGPSSFFQTNTSQSKVLYDQLVQMAKLQGTERIFDLYTGIGSIALYLAPFVKEVVGIEEVPAAIEDAKKNAALLGYTNLSFYAGDVKEILKPSFVERHGEADIIVTDPPRAGMHKEVVEFLLTLACPTIIYVSCNPATQARDLQLLSDRYDVPFIQPVDMFPHTHHVEAIAVLHKR